jgi:hypothetical protein
MRKYKVNSVLARVQVYRTAFDLCSKRGQIAYNQKNNPLGAIPAGLLSFLIKIWRFFGEKQQLH